MEAPEKDQSGVRGSDAMRCHGCGAIHLPVNERQLCKFCDEVWVAVARQRAEAARNASEKVLLEAKYMSEQTGIEWTDSTWNPWIGCHKVSPACAHCYAEREMMRYGRDFNIITRTKDATFFSATQMERTTQNIYLFLVRLFHCGSRCLARRGMERHYRDTSTYVPSAHQAA